jgi:chromosome segregation ATPase
MAPPSDPVATTDLGTSEAGRTRKLLLDEMLAERARPPLPPAPVLSVEPAPVDAVPLGGRRSARKRLAEVEALARRNLRAAEEARRVVVQERQLLEEEATARTDAERTASGLRREIERLRATEEQRAAQARFAANHEARTELQTEIERVHDEHARVVDELDRMRGTLFDHDSLLDEYSRRLHDEQEAQAIARGDQVRAEEAKRVAERNLEVATESARRRADEDAARFNKVEEAWRTACVERDRVTAELQAITTGDGELARLRSEVESAREDMTRVLGDLDVQAARADSAEAELVTLREALQTAEKAAAEAIEARDLDGITLETTRSELAEKSEALDAQRTSSQTRIADLTAQLATATRTAESATERSADLESRLDAAIATRDEAVAEADSLGEQLARAQSDTEQLRTQAASIGDELAATQGELERSKSELQTSREDARQASVAAEAAAAAAAVAATRPTERARPEPEPTPTFDIAPTDVPSVESVPSTFDAALATAFGHDAAPAPDPAPLKLVDAAPKFRIAEDPNIVRVRPGGPEVDLEASLVRGLEPIPAPAAENGPHATEPEAEKTPERTAEAQAFRRTAMAELTALAGDSDDLTPRRRR